MGMDNWFPENGGRASIPQAIVVADINWSNQQDLFKGKRSCLSAKQSHRKLLFWHQRQQLLVFTLVPSTVVLDPHQKTWKQLVCSTPGAPLLLGQPSSNTSKRLGFGGLGEEKLLILPGNKSRTTTQAAWRRGTRIKREKFLSLLFFLTSGNITN